MSSPIDLYPLADRAVALQAAATGLSHALDAALAACAPVCRPACSLPVASASLPGDTSQTALVSEPRPTTLSPAHAHLRHTFRAAPAAVAALSDDAAAAVLTALTEGVPSCGILLEPLLDAQGRLRPGACALVQQRGRGLGAHLYRSTALARWLAGGGTHPVTREAVVVEAHVFALR